METHPNPKDREKNPSPSSPNSSTSSSNSSNSNRVLPPTPPPLTPKSIPKSTEPNPNPYPTTFIQADTSSFKQVVQMLTGSAETAAKRANAASANPTPPKSPIPHISKATGPKKPAFKLYERRSSMKNLKMISPLLPSFIGSNPTSPAAAFSPRKQPEILSPSILDFPSLVLSPVTPLIPDPFNRSLHTDSAAAVSAEDRAIAEKGFYLHPSPRTTPRDTEPPRLLPLFPVTSPRVSSSASAAAADSA